MMNDNSILVCTDLDNEGFSAGSPELYNAISGAKKAFKRLGEVVRQVSKTETVYNATVFRTVEEARWAHFFDFIGAEWEQIKDDFTVEFYDETLRYRPSFYLPKFNLFVDVCPTNDDLIQRSRAIATAIDYNSTPISKSTGLLIVGAMPNVRDFDFPVYPLLRWNEGISLHGGFFMAALGKIDVYCPAILRSETDYMEGLISSVGITEADKEDQNGFYPINYGYSTAPDLPSFDGLSTTFVSVDETEVENQNIRFAFHLSNRAVFDSPETEQEKNEKV